MKKIGLLMGCFNPIHISHVNMAKTVLEHNLVDEVIVIPSLTNLNIKNTIAINNEDRFNMVKLAFEEYESIIVSDFELKQKRQLYTYETLKHFKSNDNEIYLIIGSDNLRSFNKWKNYEEILRNYKVIVLKRDDDNINDIILNSNVLKIYAESIITLEEKKVNSISSTFIRENMKDENIKKYLDAKVYNYIKERRLYEI